MKSRERLPLVLALAGLLGTAAWAAAGDPFTGNHHTHHDRTRHDHHTDRHRDDHQVRDHHDHLVIDRTVHHAGAAHRTDRVGGAGGAALMTVVPPRDATLYVLSVEVDHKILEQGKKDPDAKEAAELAAAAREHGGKLYAEVKTRVLTGARADRRGILNGLRWLRENMRPRDVALVFISSHGGFDHMGFFGVQPAGWKEKDQQATAVWGEEMRDLLAQTPGRIVFLLETCNSAQFLKTPNHLEPLPRAAVICSCRPKESSGAAMGYAAVRGLSGAAAEDNGMVTSASLEDYLKRQVVKDTKNKQHVVALAAEGLAPIPLAQK